MKKTIINNFKLIILTILISIPLILSGCSNNEKEEALNTSIDTLSILANIFPAENDINSFSFYTGLSNNYESMAKNIFDIDISLVKEMTFCVSNGADSEEYVVIKSENISELTTQLEAHIQDRIGVFTGYAPDQVDKLNNSRIITKGDYLVLIVSSNPKEQEDLFKKCMKADFELSQDKVVLKENILSAALNINNNLVDDEIIDEDDIEAGLITEIQGVIEPIDTTNIVTAYKTNDESILTDPMDVQVLNECRRIIDEVITDNMTDYEKELAIHNYIIKSTEYDANALTYEGKYTPYADTPYGTLIDKNAICLGYSTTFKLFMDILDIECIIVIGSAYETEENHAWNLVNLDDEWYAVDVTWNDPLGGENIEVFYNYLNVQDDILINSGHNWNKDDYPSATGCNYTYQ